MKKIFLLLSLIFGVCLLTNSFSEAKTPQDRLKEAYDKSHNIQQEPYSSKLEADDMFQTSNQLSIGGPNAGVGNNDSVLVRFARFFLRMAIVIGVTMLIFVGIKISLSRGDVGKMHEALKLGTKVLLGVLIALASVAIVYLVSSLMRGSLNYSLFN